MMIRCLSRMNSTLHRTHEGGVRWTWLSEPIDPTEGEGVSGRFDAEDDTTRVATAIRLTGRGGRHGRPTVRTLSSLMTAGKSMRTVLLDSGPVAHLASGDVFSPLVGADMSASDLVDDNLGFVVENGVFTRIAPSEEIEAEYGRESSVSLNHRAIVPGLVDAHAHLLWAGDRSNEMRLRQQGLSYADIAASGGGIRHTVNATRSTSEQDLFIEGQRRLNLALRNGTTALEAKSGYGLSTQSELKLLEVASRLKQESNMDLSLTWLGAHDTPPSEIREDYVEELLSEQLPAIIDQGLARSADVFCEPGWFTLEETESICKAASAEGLAIRLHVDEFADGGGLGLAAELGAITADHAGHSSVDQRAAASAAGTLQGFLPGTPYVLGSDHWPPIQQCIEEGWAWTLATDFNPNCQSLSLPMVGSMVTHRMGIDPLAALVAVSRNPASGLVRDDGLAHGVIAEGAVANLNVLHGVHVEGWCQTPGQSPFVGTLIAGEWVQHE